LKFKTPSF